MPVVARRSDLLRRQLDRFKKTIAGVERGEVRALHRARVASRRLRELVPLLQLAGHDAQKLERRLRKVTSRLGVVRELDVLRVMIDELSFVRPKHAEAFRRLTSSLDKARGAAREHLDGHLPASDMRRLAGKLQRVVDALDANRGTSAERADARAWRWAVDARIAHRAARLMDAMADAGAVYLPERLHEVRIALKKLRYAAEMAAAAGGESNARTLGTLKRAQDLLGRMHDLQVLIDRARQEASLGSPTLTAWRDLDALVTALEDDCRRLHARYVRSRPSLARVTEPLGAKPPARRRRAG
ncbi:MAG: CHAD domain-containing protein [Acidobacteria bacterium]|nr:CHAD domain-containing protein [Acidobacteriota bacterium]